MLALALLRRVVRAVARIYRQARYQFSARRFVADCLLVVLGIAGVSLLIAVLHLYPRVRNISILYLLVVLALAVWRGRVAAIVAAIGAFLIFDLLFIPPLYTLTVSDPSEWLALGIFLIVAVIAGTLAANLREQAQEARWRAREATLLYEFARMLAAEPDLERLLPKVAGRLREAFPAMRGCVFLVPEGGSLVACGAAGEMEVPAGQERVVATAQKWVLEHGQPVVLAGTEQAGSGRYVPYLRLPLRWRSAGRSIRLLPLLVGERAVGVLQVVEEPRAG
jgi:two-component system sensor histidine kinase KdpD